MPLPAITDIAREHLFADRGKLVAAGLPEPTIRHLERLRDIYSYWVSFPSKRDRDIVAELRSRYGIGDSVAREDLRLIKTLLGNIEKVSKEYMRYHVTQMLERAYEKAEAANNPREMIAAAKVLKEVHQLDKEDDRTSILDKVVPLKLEFTDDPTTIGFERVPDFRDKIRKLKELYWVKETEYVDFEDLDAGIDDLFNPKQLPHATTAETGLS